MNLADISGISDEGEERNSISFDAYSRINKTIDKKGMINECLFLKHCYEKQADVNEPQWFAMINLISKSGNNPDESRRICHEYSRQHPKYACEETDDKVNNAFNHGPRRCSSIASIWDGCKECPHYGKVESPVFIKSNDFIPTEHSGFFTVKIERGVPQVVS